MILIPASEVPDLLEALNEKALSLQGEIATTRCPETREACEEQHRRVRSMIDRIVPAYRMWNDTDDHAWCMKIEELAEAAEEATATPAGRNPVFAEIRAKVAEEVLQ